MLVELLPLAQTSRLDFGTQTDSHETELRPERDRAELRPPGRENQSLQVQRLDSFLSELKVESNQLKAPASLKDFSSLPCFHQGDRRAKREARASDGVTAPGPVSCRPQCPHDGLNSQRDHPGQREKKRTPPLDRALSGSGANSSYE